MAVDLRNLNAIRVPEKLLTLASDEAIELKVHTELDQSPTPIADFALSNKKLRERLFSDLPHWADLTGMPFMAGIPYHENVALEKARNGDREGSLESYFASRQMALMFANYISHMQEHVLLSGNELQTLLKTERRNYSPLELGIVDALDDKHLLPNPTELAQKLVELRETRKEQAILRTHKYQGTAEEARAFARQKGWYSIASDISNNLNDLAEETEDNMQLVLGYPWLDFHVKRNIAGMQLHKAFCIKDFEVFDRVLETYAKKQAELDIGVYGPNGLNGLHPGWSIPVTKFDHDEYRTYETQEDTSPLLFSVVLGYTPKNITLDDKVKAVRAYIARMPEIVPKLQQFWKDLSAKEREHYEDIPRICNKIHIRLKAGR